MRRVLALGPVAIVLAVGGCGGSPASGSASGAVVFASSCSVCHSLAGNESRRTQGGDLVGYRLSHLELVQLVAEMPVRRRLTAAELRAVVNYVAAAERHRG